MRVSRLAFAAAATAAMTALLPVVPTSAQANAAISVSPTDPKPGDTITVTGTSDCASVAYTVTLSYTNPDEDTATTTATGTTDASGEFTQSVTIPDNAFAGEPASVVASIACSGGAQETNEVELDIVPHEGTLSVSPTQGERGTTVSISGTNCLGGEVAVLFGDGEEETTFEVENVTLNPDRTFSATYVIPNGAATGPNAFVALCPGTDYEPVGFLVLASETDGPPANPPANPPAAPPAVPVVDTPTFTG